jgi:xylulokinase
MKYAIGIDVGTSSTKSVIFNEKGDVIYSASREYPLYQPKNGYAEQDPSDWYNACVSTIKEIISESAVSAGDIVGIGLSGQMHGLVMLDENNEVIRRSIIWCDQRTAKECEEITERVGTERLIEITANPALTGFTASKILWVRNNEPENYKKCRHILLPKDYVRFKLTGVYATEVSDASGMQLLDVPNRCWSDEVLEKLDIDKSMLAKVYESPEITGYITEEMAALTGLKAGTPVVGGAGDNAAAAVGTGVVADGKAFTTIGTSGVVFAHTSDISIDPKGRVHTFCCAVPGCWHIMGVTQGAGLSLKWYKDNFCQDESNTAKLQKAEKRADLDAEGGEGGGSDLDEKFYAALELAVDMGKISSSYLQRKLNLGFQRAARIIDQMEELGYIGEPNGSKPRDVLITKQDFQELMMRNEEV